MFFQYGTEASEKQSGEEESQFWVSQLETYLAPYSERLDAYLDRRVVGNLTAVVAGIVQTRAALTTSELGSAITGPAHAEAREREAGRLGSGAFQSRASPDPQPQGSLQSTKWDAGECTWL